MGGIVATLEMRRVDSELESIRHNVEKLAAQSDRQRLRLPK